MTNSSKVLQVDKCDPETKPTALFRGVPAPLWSRRPTDAWVIWDWTWNGKRWDKPPKRARGSGSASTTNPATWCSADEAESAASSRGGGVGYVLTKDPDLLVLDLDNVIDANGEAARWASDLIDECASYTEVSPSGRGYKIFGTAQGLGPKHKTVRMPAGELEIFHQAARYVCVTGASDHPDRPLRDLTEIASRFLAEGGTPDKHQSGSLISDHHDADGPRQEDVKRALDGFWDPDAYGDWATAALALHSAPWGRETWLTWAAKSQKFDRAENEGKWAETVPTKGISSLSILARVPKGTLSAWGRDHARQAGVDVGGLSIFQAGNPTANAAAKPWLQPFKYRPPETMPRRQWLYAGHFIRRFVTITIAPGGVGKSSLVLVEALAMASGRALLGIEPNHRCRVAYFNGEDPGEEGERRVLAAMIQYGLTAADVEGWLYLGSGRDQGVKIAEQSRDGLKAIEAEVAKVVWAIQTYDLDVVILDPFVRIHGVGENDNSAVDFVVNILAKIADTYNVAVEIVHHTRKHNGCSEETSVEDGRGAGALLSAARSARVLNMMSENEAANAGVEARREYFKVTNGKANLAPPPDRASWYHLVGVDLGNGPIGGGDKVAVVTPWTWPDAFEGIKALDTLKVQQEVDGGPWRENQQAADWVGYAVAEALGLDLGPAQKADQRPDHKRARGRVKSLLRTWLANGLLTTEVRLDAKRMERKFVVVGQWIAP